MGAEGKDLAVVNIEIVSADDLDGTQMLAKVDDGQAGVGLFSKADSALQATSDVLEAIPEKGLFKVEVPEGFTIQDLAKAKGDEGAFRAVVKGPDNKIAGQAKLREVGGVSPTQLAGVGLAAAAMVVGQAYMTEISDSLHRIDEKLDSVVSMLENEQKSKLTNALDVARNYIQLYEHNGKTPEAFQAARNEIERNYNEVGAVADWVTLQLGEVDKRAREAKASKKDLRPLIEELHSREEQFSMCLQTLSALGMTRMYYDGATDENSALIERGRIVDKSQKFLRARNAVAGVMEVKIGALKGAPLAIPSGNDKNPLKNLTSKTPRAAARQNLLESKRGMQSDLRSAEKKVRASSEKCREGIDRISEAAHASKTILTDGNDCWLLEGPKGK